MSHSSVGEDVTVFDFIELLQASDWVTSPVYAGWLQKKSKGWFVSHMFAQYSWQPKWVSLHGLELIYMDEEPTNENINSIRIRRTTIGSTTKIMPFNEEDRADPLSFCIQPDCTKPRIWQFRAESEEEKTNWLIKISQVHAIATWLDAYTKERVLGVGAQGTVYEIVHKSTGERFAMKEVNIENEKQMQMAITEAKLLKEITRNVCHPCIMQIEKVFQVVDKFYLVFPLCTGGELYEAVVRRGHFTERKAARIMKDLVSALQALHEYNILHLDIKPENILFESNDPNARIKLTDFGLSKIFSESLEVKRHSMPTKDELIARTESFINCGNFNADHVRGTFGYMSPELILCGYSSTGSDVFAAGVILYILLCGYPPFNSKSVRQLFVRTVKGAYKLSGPEWDAISMDAKDLVRKMLDISPETRITTHDILSHPWILKAAELDPPSCEVVNITEKSGSVAVSSEQFDGLVGKSSVVHGHLLHKSVLDAVDTPTSAVSGKSDVNLTKALDHLADHIKVLKTEKLAKAVTRLMIAKATTAGSKLGEVYLHRDRMNQKAMRSSSSRPISGRSAVAMSMEPIIEEDLHSHVSDIDDIRGIAFHSQNSTDLASELETSLGDASCTSASVNTATNIKYEELQQMVNSEGKEIVLKALFRYFGADEKGNLTLEQFIVLLKRFGLLGADTDIGNLQRGGTSPTGAAVQTIIASAGLAGLLMAKFADRQGKGYITQEDFFAVQVLILQRDELYLRALYKQYQHSVWYAGRHENFQFAMRSLGRANTPNVNSVMIEAEIEPPKLISSKHVSTIFERYGYSPRNGRKVFDLLCDVLAKLRSERAPSSYGTGATTSGLNVSSAADIGDESAVSEGYGEVIGMYDQITATAKGMIGLRLKTDNDVESAYSSDNSSQVRTPSPITPTSLGSHSNISSASASPLPSTPLREMDVEEFIHVAKMDEILVDVFSKDAHARFFALFQCAERKYLSQRDRMDLGIGEDSAKYSSLEKAVSAEVSRLLDDATF